MPVSLINQNKTDQALEISEQGRERAFVELLAQQQPKLSDISHPLEPLKLNQIRRSAQEQNPTLILYSALVPLYR